MDLLDIRNLSVEVNGQLIIRDLNLTICSGKIDALMGPNGSGKSSLCLTIIGHPQYKIISGEIRFAGEVINNWLPEKRSIAGIMATYQSPVDLPGVSVGDYLRLTTNKHHRAPGFRSRLYEALSLVGLNREFAARDMDSGISGGEKKRLEIATVLLHKPKFLILDEIDSGLDVDALRQITGFLGQYLNVTRSMLVITHNQRILKLLKPSKVHLISAGTVVKRGGYQLSQKIDKEGYHSIGVAK